MDVTGESDVMDFNFEELEFIDGDLGDLGDDPNAKTEEELEAEETAAAEAAGKAAQEGKTAEEIAAEAAAAAGEAPEGGSSESVGGKSTEGNDGDGEATSPKLYQALTDTLREKGVLSSVEESSLKGVDNVEGLIDLIKEQIKAEELSDLSDVQKDVLDDMRRGVSPDTAKQYKDAITNLNSLEDTKIAEDKQVRFDLIYQDFLSKGLSREKASKYANMSFKAGDDLTDAKEAKVSLLTAVKTKYDKSKQTELDAIASKKADKEKTETSLKDKILNNKEVMEGVQVSENVRKEVYEAMVKTVSTNPDTGTPENELMQYQRENPLEYSNKLYYLFKVTNGFKDMSFFNNKKMSGAVNNLERALRQSTHVSGGGSPSFADDMDASMLDIGDLVIPE